MCPIIRSKTQILLILHGQCELSQPRTEASKIYTGVQVCYWPSSRKMTDLLLITERCNFLGCWIVLKRISTLPDWSPEECWIHCWCHSRRGSYIRETSWSFIHYRTSLYEASWRASCRRCWSRSFQLRKSCWGWGRVGGDHRTKAEDAPPKSTSELGTKTKEAKERPPLPFFSSFC